MIDNKLKNAFRTSSTYDFYGRRISSTTQNWNDSLWCNLIKVTLAYHPQGFQHYFFVEYWKDTNWVNDRWWLFNYNDDWVLSSVLVKKWIKGEWNDYGKVSFIYNKTEFQVIELMQIWNNLAWINAYKCTYSYNENNYFKRGFFEHWQDNTWIPEDGIIHIYNPDGFVDHFWTHEVLAYYGQTTSIKEEGKFYLQEYELSQNYPNPFNSTTRIKYAVGSTEYVVLKVFDLLGREVVTLVNEPKQSGEYEVEFDANKYGLTSGIYFYQLRSGEFVETKKFVLMK